MKTCLCCLQPQPDSAETCSECGEASWGDTHPQAPSASPTKPSPARGPAQESPPAPPLDLDALESKKPGKPSGKPPAKGD